MAHTFFCEFCGKRFDVDETLIGKRARCKDCKHEFVIPGVKNEPPAHDPYGWNDPLSPPVPPHQNPYSLQEEEVLPPRLGKPLATPKRRRRAADGFAWIKPVTMFGVAVGLMLLLNIAIFAHDQPVVFHGLSILFGLLVFSMLLSGYVISLMIPFFEDTTEGFLCFFVPCYKFYYYLNHREELAKPFLPAVAATILAGLGVALVYFHPGARAALDLKPAAVVANNPEYERLVEQEIATYYEMKDVLAKVNSSEEAQDVAERYTTLANQFSGLQKQTKELSRNAWKISAAQINRLHGEDYKHAQMAYLGEVVRVSKIEGVTAVLKLDRYAWQNRFLARSPELRIEQARIENELARQARAPADEAALYASHEALVKEGIATFNGLADLLAKVTDKVSAQSIADRHADLIHDALRQNDRQIRLPNLNDPGQHRLRAQYETAIELARNRYASERDRLDAIGGVADILGFDKINRQLRASHGTDAQLRAEMDAATQQGNSRSSVLAKPTRWRQVASLRPRQPLPKRSQPDPARPAPAPPRNASLARKPGALEPRKLLSGSPAKIAELLGTPQRVQAVATLKTMGPAAEAAVIPHLRSDNWGARNDACQILKVIGTEQSVAELRVIAGNHGPSAQDAREALRLIASRSGALDPQAAEPGGVQRGDP